MFFVLKYVKFPLFFPYGRFYCSIPEHIKLTIIYSDPLKCSKNNDETINEAVDRIHTHVSDNITPKVLLKMLFQ